MTYHVCIHYLTIPLGYHSYMFCIVIFYIPATGKLSVSSSFLFKVKSNSRRIRGSTWCISLHKMGKIDRLFFFVFNICKYVALNRNILFCYSLYFRLLLFILYKRKTSIVFIFMNRYRKQCAEQTSTCVVEYHRRWH